MPPTRVWAIVMYRPIGKFAIPVATTLRRTEAEAQEKMAMLSTETRDLCVMFEATLPDWIVMLPAMFVPQEPTTIWVVVGFFRHEDGVMPESIFFYPTEEEAERNLHIHSDQAAEQGFTFPVWGALEITLPAWFAVFPT